jgi:hypothetical protein
MKRSHGEMIKHSQSTLETPSIINPTTIKELQIKRNKFKTSLDCYNLLCIHRDIIAYSAPISLLSYTYLQHLHKKTCLEVLYYTYLDCIESIPNENFFLHFNIDKLEKGHPKHLTTLKNARHYDGEYSALGSATMADKVSFQEKQGFIQKLLNLGFKPTKDDKELALVEQWGRWEPIIKKILLLRYAQFFIEIPCTDVTKYIEWLMLETEKSLF